MLLRPVLDDMEIPALLNDIKLSGVHVLFRVPIHRHDVQVTVAHEGLAEIVEAVFYLVVSFVSTALHALLRGPKLVLSFRLPSGYYRTLLLTSV